MRKCSEVMTREPVCCEPGESIVQVAATMKAEDVGSIPVVESQEDKKLIGIVTDRDLVVKVLAEGKATDGATVRNAMTANPASCRESDDVRTLRVAFAGECDYSDAIVNSNQRRRIWNS